MYGQEGGKAQRVADPQQKKVCFEKVVQLLAAQIRTVTDLDHDIGF
jgi:hypothetical protein